MRAITSHFWPQSNVKFVCAFMPCWFRYMYICKFSVFAYTWDVYACVCLNACMVCLYGWCGYVCKCMFISIHVSLASLSSSTPTLVVLTLRENKSPSDSTEGLDSETMHLLAGLNIKINEIKEYLVIINHSLARSGSDHS
jgi:hypothetical protein